MLDILAQSQRTKDCRSRRNSLQAGEAGMLGLSMTKLLVMRKTAMGLGLLTLVLSGLGVGTFAYSRGRIIVSVRSVRPAQRPIGHSRLIIRDGAVPDMVTDRVWCGPIQISVTSFRSQTVHGRLGKGPGSNGASHRNE